ncbi:MAG: hypothetical protein ABSF63_01650 [Candidatus Bathyarchaeia archaeon]
MTLVEMWTNNKEGIRNKTLAQILAFAGEGKLADGNDCSREFRDLVSSLSLDILKGFANQALASKESDFPDRSYALQDLVNELGKRLGFSVQYGLYRGRQGESGHDGLWIDPDDKHPIIIESKSSTNYPIKLDTLARFKTILQKQGSIESKYSALIVIGGNEDTGDLEAQIRGSRQAWDTRVISLGALFSLASLKIETDEPDSARLIRNVLIPREYTKLDGLVEIVSFIADDVSEDELELEPTKQVKEAEERPYVSKLNSTELRDDAKAILAKMLDHSLKDISRTLLESDDGSIGICYAQSRQYERGNLIFYWFALHDRQIDFLKKHAEMYLAYHCVGTGLIFIPWRDFESNLKYLGESSVKGRHWYHIHLQEAEGKIHLKPSSHDPVDVTKWLLPS